MTKKGMAALLFAALMMLAAFAGAEGTRAFVDDAGREVELDADIDRVIVTGQLGQTAVFAIAPQKLVGLVSAWDDDAAPYIDTQAYDLPLLGQIYGGRGNANLEEMLAVQPQVVIDIGEPKDGLAEDLDALQEQTGLPFVHISAHIDRLDETYTRLGELLGMPEEGRVLSEYCARVYARCADMAQRAQKVRLLYIVGVEGLGVIARDSYHSAVIDMFCDNVAVIESPSARGTGNEVDMEQILDWNPDVILFSQSPYFETAKDDPLWQAVSAIESGRYYDVPVGPYNWMGFPPGVQRLLGMMWMGKLLCGELADYDLYEETAQYFDLFYHSELTREQYDALTADSIGRLSH
ncbi:MAG: ABC transporter substrate-binding protein [Clostridia bacterium]|nr:ABC transporter substrate-binding protein [Clostridia bacterium]